jgi:hypothetical protein
MRYYDRAFIQPNLQRMYGLLADGTTAMLHVVPGGALIDNAQQGNRGEAGLSAIGDAAGFLGPLAGLAKGARTARNLRIAAVGLQAGLGATRLGQGFYAVYNGQGNQAAGYFGEGILRLLGASATGLRLLKGRAAVGAAPKNVPSSAPNIVNPSIPKAAIPPASLFGGSTFQQWGKGIVNWGSGAKEALARISTLTKLEIQRLGITRAQAQAALDFYKNEMLRNPGNATAAARVTLMEHVLSQL